MSSVRSQKAEQSPARGSLRSWRSQWILQAFALFGLAFFIVFSYIPMFGIIIAFKDYKVTMGLQGFFTAPWVGLRWIEEFYRDIMFWPIIRNTVWLSLLKLVFSFPMPILFALMINEVRNTRIKRSVQTISYLPHFMAWVVVAGLLFSFLNEQNGLINQLLVRLGLVQQPIRFLSMPQYFRPMAVLSDIWKSMGWFSIIFLAAIANVDQEMYEAAIVDGASRMQRIRYITLPAITGTFVIVLILNLGGLFGGGLGGSNFEQAYLLGNDVNRPTSEILQTYTLKMGLAQGRYPYATAIGLVQSLISLIIIYLSNLTARRVSGYGLF